MLGWHISVYRQRDGGVSPATARSPEGTRLAVWQTGSGGRDWLEELVKVGKAIDLSGDCYPYRYTSTAQYLFSRIIHGPLGVRTYWARGASDVVTDKWEGKTVVDRAEVAQCRPDEWLLVEAWDES